MPRKTNKEKARDKDGNFNLKEKSYVHASLVKSNADGH